MKRELVSDVLFEFRNRRYRVSIVWSELLVPALALSFTGYLVSDVGLEGPYSNFVFVATILIFVIIVGTSGIQVRSTDKSTGHPLTRDRSDTLDTKDDAPGVAAISLLVVGSGIYIALLHVLGFILDTILYMAFMTMLLGGRPGYRVLASFIGFSTALGLFCAYMLNVRLPLLPPWVLAFVNSG